MATAPTNEAALLAQIKAELDSEIARVNGGIQPPPLPTIPTQVPQRVQIGADYVDPTDQVAVNAAIARTTASYQTELQALKQQVAGHVERQAPTDPNTPSATVRVRPTVDDWARETQHDPAAAADKMLGAAWGLPAGMGASAAMAQLVDGLKKLNEEQAGLKTALANQGQAQQRSYLDSEAMAFEKNNSDFDREANHWQPMRKMLEQYGLQPTREGLTAAFKLAKAEGLIGGQSQQTQTQHGYQQAPNPGGALVPSLRPSMGAQPQNETVDNILQKIEALPQAQQGPALQRYISQFQALEGGGR